MVSYNGVQAAACARQAWVQVDPHEVLADE